MGVNVAVRRWANHVFQPIAVALASWGVSPNALTFIGFFLTAGVSVVLALGHMTLGGILVIFTSLFDALDGMVARASGRASRFGAFLDSTLDRYAEAALFSGLLVYYLGRFQQVDVLLLFAVLTGSFMVSYTRARAEGLGLECKEGILTRLERMVILILGLVSGQVRVALWILAVLANVTAVQRIHAVWRKTCGERDSHTKTW